MKNVSDKSCRENKNSHFVFKYLFFFRKSCLLGDNVEKYCTAGQATNDNMAHAHCMLDTWSYKHALRICNIITFPIQQRLHGRAAMTCYTYIFCLFLPMQRVKKSTLLAAFTENFIESLKSADSLNSMWDKSEGHLLKLTLLSSVTLVPTAAPSNTWVCGRSLPGIEDLNPGRGCIVLGLQKYSLDDVETNCCFLITADVKWL